MPIKVECDICGAKYRVGDHRAGRRIPCKECGADIRVPAAPGGGSARPGPAGPAGSARPAGSGRPAGPTRSGGTIPLARSRPRPADDDDEYLEDAGDSARLWMALGVGAVMAVGIVIVVIVSLSGGDEDAVANNAPSGPATNPFNSSPPRPAPSFPGIGPSTPNANGNASANAAPGNAAASPSPPFGGNAPPALPGNAQPFPGARNNPRVRPNPARPPGRFGDGQPLAGQPFDGGAPADAPPEAWSAKADPPAQAVQFDPSRKIEIDLPDDASATDVVFPSSYGPYVAVGKFDKAHTLDVWNLQNKSRVGRVGGVDLGYGKKVLSNDGKYFAAAGTSTDGILIWDVEESKGLVQFPPPGSGGYDVLEFAGSSRVLAAQGGLSEDKPLYVWTLPEGKAERSLAMPKGTVKESLATSPGGRYLALFASHFNEAFLRVYDLTTGEVAGQASPPPVEFGRARCHALEFSPDGAELAGLFDAGSNSQLCVWNMNDGRMTDQIVVERSAWRFSRDHGRPVQWFPNKQRWLLGGDAVVDRGAKDIIFAFPEDRSDRAPRQVLDDTRIAVVTGQRDSGTVTAFELSEDVLAKAQAIVQQGGESVDAALPPLKMADLASARPILGGATDWSVQPDPVAAAAEVLLKTPLQVAASDAKLTGFWLADPAAARAALFYEVENRPAAVRRGRTAARSRDADSPVRLTALDLHTGKPAAELSVPFPCKFLSMSPSGRRAVFALAKTEDRLDVYSLDDEQHVLGFRPYQAEENDGHKKVTAAVFVDDEHLLTMNPQHRLVLWELGTAKAVYQIENAQQLLTSPPGLSPGNKSLVVFGEKICHFYESLTGEPQGSLSFEGQAAAAAFSPDGTRFAAVARASHGARVYVWSLVTGQPEKDFPLPKRSWIGRGMHFCGTDHVLFNETGAEFVLIDLPHESVAWIYRQAPWGQHYPISPDGRHWLLAPPRLGSKEVYLAALELPSKVESTRLASADLTPKFVVQPGSQVSLAITLPAQAPGHDNFPAAVEKNLIERFQQQGISVVQGAPTTVQVSMTEQSTGKTHKFHSFGFGRGNYEVPEKVFECKVVFMHQGRPVWESVARISNNAFHIRLQEGQSLETVLSEQQWRSATNHFIGFQPPSHVFSEGAEKGFGSSQLAPGGPQ